MPYKSWIHHCAQRQREVITRHEYCEHCGQPGQFAGWRYNRIEAAGAYSHFTGLKAAGSHRPLADELLADYILTCEACSGRGLLDVDNGDSYRICPMCSGAGHTLKVEPEVFFAARLQILMMYPDAAVGVPSTDEESKYDKYAQ